MKVKLFPFVALMFTLLAIATTVQEVTLTATAANTVSAKSLIDMPGLTGNPLAIIVATPNGATEALNPHPVWAMVEGTVRG